ncbi:hypothetical protein EO081_03240 [Sphingomonas desiccabilis]|uniref:O-antigen ligase domain-containing protein n=2 Tax=Sphingomonas desiccabilis TaxID=429134 RepID=A0A4V1QPR3_9SPHN|nr:hypothetical protein EO081_03240 [Sphingomonas desiccabilis]
MFWAFVMLMVTNVALAKAGFSTGSTPVTFGYLLMGALAPFALIGLIVRPVLSPAALLHVLLAYLPVGLFAVYKVETAFGSPAELLVTGTNFLILPVIIIGLFSPYLEDLTEAQICTVLKWCVRFAVAWGLMNFFMYALTKSFIAIPYLTMNAADAAEVFGKNNRRGGFMKLVSTYNNGNIFGVCMIALGPVYLYAEKSRAWMAAFLLAILLTLSRSAWFGMVVMGGVMVALGQVRVNRGPVWLGGLAAVGGIVIIMPFLGWTSDNLFDSNLGGRFYQVEQLVITWFGAPRVSIKEIIYLGLLQSFGLIGFLFVMLALTFPILVNASRLRTLPMLRRAAIGGTICYLAMAALDGAFIFPPVLAIFLFLGALTYRRGYRGAAGRAALPATAAI